MNTKLARLEKKFNVATELIQELTDDVETLPVVVDEKEEKSEDVFSMSTLKTDFLLVRNNVLKLVNTGQRVLDTASLIDVSDLQANQLKALSDMQVAIGGNLKLLISIYKEIAEIEKMRIKEVSKTETTQNVNNGNVTNNQIMFSGSSNELLDLIKDNQNINNTDDNTILIEKDVQ